MASGEKLQIADTPEHISKKFREISNQPKQLYTVSGSAEVSQRGFQR